MQELYTLIAGNSPQLDDDCQLSIWQCLQKSQQL